MCPDMPMNADCIMGDTLAAWHRKYAIIPANDAVIISAMNAPTVKLRVRCIHTWFVKEVMPPLMANTNIQA
jgi:hypothetical protein